MEATTAKLLQGATATGAAILSYWLGGVDTVLVTIASLMVLDLAAGTLKGIYNKQLDSKISAKGIAKKAGELVALSLGVLLDRATGSDIFRMIMATGIIAHEGLSILENIGAFVEYPEYIKQFLEQLKNNADKGEPLG